MIPGTIMYVYFGTLARSIADIATEKTETPLAARIFFLVGLVFAIAVTIFITRIARKALKQAVLLQ